MVRSFLLRALLASLLLGLFCLPSRAADKTPLADDHEAAREAVRQALVAETLGDNTGRARKLGEAILAAPDLDAANWHLARVKSGEKWLPLSQAEEAAAEDAQARDYEKRREKVGKSAKLLRDLARHCTKLGWTDRAQLHYAQLLAHADATKDMREEAIERLELVQVGGNWITKEELEARQAEAKAIQQSLAKWRPKLKALQLVIDGPDFAKRDKAIEQLHQLDDPQMIPALESFLLDGKADFQEQAVKRLAAFPQHEATEALVRYAVLAESAIVGQVAVDTLKQRPMVEYCPLLLEGLVAPIKSRFVISRDRSGNVTYTHTLGRETIHNRFIVSTRQTASPLGVWVPARGAGPVNQLLIDRVREQETIAEAQRAAADTQLVAGLINVSASSANARIISALQECTGQVQQTDVKQWFKWWENYNEYDWPKPTQYVHRVAKLYYIVPNPMSCFLAGTPIRTQAGLVPIETIQPGDLVLAQDQDTGELTYKLVLRTTLRPPAKMVRITAGSEAITTTLGHPFWVSGHGWKMAKELKAGDRLHSHGGAIEVASIEPLEKPEPAHNLVVADFNSYFVGNQGLLVHDNEFRQPTRAVVPGLVLAE